MKVSIIVPAYNEERRIDRTLEAYSRFFEELRKNDLLDYEIIIVINNTKDKTEQIVKTYVKKNKRILYLNLVKGGKGYAIKEGFKDALKRSNDLIGFVDADMATKPEEYYNLIKKVNNVDGVIASRYIKGAIVKPRNTLARIFASRLFNALFRAVFLLPYKDTQCGAKVFKRKAIEGIVNDLGITQFAFDIDLIYKLRKKKFRIKEFPTIWADQKYQTINFWHSGPFMALAIIRLRILSSPLRRFVRIYDKFIGFIPK